jgi:hypothetical protein
MAERFQFEHLTFSLYPDAHRMKMYESYYRDGAWDHGSIVPYHNIELSPAANILNYGQGIFEGIKAYYSVKGHIVLFRPDQNAKRFIRSALKLAMPPVTEEQFMNAVRDVVLANEFFIPESKDGKYTLYLRPVCVGTEPLLGVRAAKEYLFYIFASPVGPYFDRVGIVRLMTSDVHRAAPHGTGDAKAVSNYAVTMWPAGTTMRSILTRSTTSLLKRPARPTFLCWLMRTHWLHPRWAQSFLGLRGIRLFNWYGRFTI